VRERIRKGIANARVVIDGQELAFSLSIGMASLLQNAGNAADLMAAADADMYRAKQSSRPELALLGA